MLQLLFTAPVIVNAFSSYSVYLRVRSALDFIRFSCSGKNCPMMTQRFFNSCDCDAVAIVAVIAAKVRLLRRSLSGASGSRFDNRRTVGYKNERRFRFIHGGLATGEMMPVRNR